MASYREQLLEASEDEDKFLDLLKKHHSKDDPFDLSEVLPTLDRKLMDQLWVNLQTKFTTLLLTCDLAHDLSQENEDFEKCCSVIQAIVTIAMETIMQEDPYLPKALLETAIILHGILLSMPDSLDKLKNGISRLCEAWWKQDLMCRHELGTQTITYLLQRSALPTGSGADVKRVSQMHEILSQVDFNNDSSVTLKKLLEQTAVSMLYLKNDDGRKFLCHLFNLNPTFTESLHKTVKNHLPWCPRSVLPLYGEVYFRAWKNAIGPNLEKLEKGCIQDLMYHSILSQPKLSSALRKLLSYFHQHKKQRGVDEMLVTLYEPILWRHLKVANGQVRLHAVSLLIDAFPLQSPEAGLEEKDLLLQRQFDVLREMLYDPHPSVRATVVFGVCTICRQYWELIPPQTIKEQITCIVSELVYDGASADVRVAVIRGLTTLVDHPLAHSMLKSLLPSMSNCFHDTSEKVRVAFVDMLLKVKGVKAIKFWHVVPLDHLLARLEVDPPSVARRIVKLLLNSYMPPDKEEDVFITRCISLIETNPGAARRFYQYVIPHQSLGSMVRLMVMVLTMLEDSFQKKVAKSQEPAEGAEVDPNTTAKPDFLESFGEDRSQADPKTGAAAKSNEDLLIDNKDTVAGLLEVAVILWSGLYSKFKQDSNKKLRENLERKASIILPRLYNIFQDSRILSALLMLSGFIPHNMMPTVSLGLVSRLKQMTPESSPEDYKPLLEVVCKWGKVKDILELISDWLLAGLMQDTPEPKARRSRSVGFIVPTDPQPLLALDFLYHMTQQKLCRNILLKDGGQDLREVAMVSRKVLKCVEKRLKAPEALGELASDEFLSRAFEEYLKLEILLHDKDNLDHNAITVIEQILTWTDMELVPALKKKATLKKHRRLLGQDEMSMLSSPSTASGTLGGDTLTMSETALGQTVNETANATLLGVKRSAGEGGNMVLKEFTAQLVQRLLDVATNMLLVGIGDHELASHLADFSLTILELGDNTVIQLLPQICKLMYQITEMTLTLDAASDEGVGSQGDLVPGMLNKSIEMIVKLTTQKREQAERVLPLIKPALAEMLNVFFAHHSMDATIRKDVMATIVTAIIVNMMETIKKDNTYESRSTIQELPTLTAFFLNLVYRKPPLLSLFLSETCACLNSGSVAMIEGIAGACHLTYTLTQCKRSISELKDCVLALDAQADIQKSALEEALEDSPSRQMLATCIKLISDSKTKIGMV